MSRFALAWRCVLFLALVLPAAGPAAAFERQVQDLASELAAQLHAKQARTVAVVDFADLRGEVNELGRFLAEELSISLTEAAGGRFQVIDRTRLAVVFAEHQLAASGLIAPEQAKRLGRLVGADVLVSATMTPFGDSVRLSVKALDTETAALTASSRGDVPRTGAIEDLLSRVVESGSGGADGNGEPTRRDDRLEPVSAKSFTFELQSCSLSGTTVDCLIVVENEVADRALMLSEESRLFDELGNEYQPQLLRIANSTERANRYSYRENVSKVVIQGVPTPLGLTFEGVSAQAARASVLKLWLVTDDTPFHVTFRDFPFGSP